MRAVAPGARGLTRARREPPAVSRRAGSALASVFVLLAFAGTWLGHSLEYFRVSGASGLARAMSGSAHLYMLPLGAVLLVAAGLGGMAWVRGVMSLAHRLQALRDALLGGRRPRHVPARRAVQVPSRMARVGSLWLLLGAAQIALYLVQENLEARAAGLRAPGFGAVFGTHWAAVPIHLMVAGVLAAAASGLVRYRRRLERAVAQHERVHARLWATRVAPVPAASYAPRPLTPHERWSSQRWQRPPPSLIAA